MSLHLFPPVRLGEIDHRAEFTPKFDVSLVEPMWLLDETPKLKTYR